MLAALSAGDWGAIATVALAFITIGGIAGAKGSDAIKKVRSRRGKFDVILSAFEGTAKNEMTGEEGNPPLLVQLKEFAAGMTKLTQSVERLESNQVDDHAMLVELATASAK
jgi:hypothetical protein